MNPVLHRLALAGAIIAFCVIVLGAFVRLSDAGLGCPDWPGCYGQLTWPTETGDIGAANESFPERPVDHGKAWKEMVHRYLAGCLVLLVIALNFIAWRGARQASRYRPLASAVLALILLQAALGMWTVTLKLLPFVVLAHLLGGMATLSFLLWLALRSGIGPANYAPGISLRRTRPWVIAALVALTAQIALGGWTSANYSALACPDFPTCQGAWLPPADFAEGFKLLRQVGVDYEGGVLDLSARVAIHLAHRLGAVVVTLMLIALAVHLLRSMVTRRSGLMLLLLLGLQLTLGILNIELALPLANAVAHNAVAAMLLAQLVWLLHRSWPGTG